MRGEFKIGRILHFVRFRQFPLARLLKYVVSLLCEDGNPFFICHARGLVVS